MLRSYISLIEQDMNQLRSSVASIGEIWNDRVSAHVERTYISASISACNSFYSDAYTAVGIVEEKEQLLHRLSDKY